MLVPNGDVKTMSEKGDGGRKTPAKAEPKAEPKGDDKDRHSSSKERHSPTKDNYYIKKRILSAIKRSFRSTAKSVDGANDDEKLDASKSHQSVTIIVKRIDLDKESILYTREKGVPEAIDLETFKVKEVPASRSNDADHHNSANHADRKRSSDEHHRSEKRQSEAQHADKKKADESSHRSSAKKPHISDDTLKGPYLLCHSCGRKYEKKWVHADCKSKCCRSTAIYCDSCLRHKIIKNDYYNKLVRDVSFGKYMYVVKCPSGRGCSLHMDYERIMHLRSAEQKELAKEFLKQAFKEDDKGFATYTIAIVHNGARYMPDMLKLLAKTYPTLKVNTTKLKSGTETEFSDLLSYYKKVKETYNFGTFSHNPLNETQAACVKNADEYGGYLPEMLSLLEQSPFLAPVLPWGELTTKKFKTPQESDDGPIFWCRPGEQIISLDRNSQRNRWNSTEIESFLQERKKNMNVSEKKLIVEELKKYRRSNSAREFRFEDRTRPHADQAWGNSFEATAAVGVIQAIHPDEHPDFNRICKEIVVFQAKHLEILEALLHIDTTAAPKQQCAEWLDDAKLNMIRQMKIEFSKLHLRDNDIYFIPRKIVHQFKTVSATLSIAWHTRLREYYKDGDAESAAPLTTATQPTQPTPRNCVGVTPKKKNRCRSESLEWRAHEAANGSAKKRKHESNHRSRSSSKKFKEEVWRENGHKAVELAAVANEQNRADAATAESAPHVQTKPEQRDCAVGKKADCAIDKKADCAVDKKADCAIDVKADCAIDQTVEPPTEPPSVKEEPRDADGAADSPADPPADPAADSPADPADSAADPAKEAAVKMLTPRVRIVDIRSHLAEDEQPVTACAAGPTYPVVNNGSTTSSRCGVDQTKTECATGAVVDASHPIAETRPAAEQERSSQNE